ncbi:MAG: YidH family protein [Desulfotomaculales bacterium]
MPEKKEQARPGQTGTNGDPGARGDRLHIREHLANERTFLSWIRTSVGILAFGFVMEKFNLYMRLLTGSLPGVPGAPSASAALPQTRTGFFGVLFTVISALIIVLAAARFKIIQRQIETRAYRPSATMDLLLAATILFVAVIMTFYLTRSTPLP